MYDSLYEIASRFRNAIMRALATGKVKEKSQFGFPNGWCGFASDFLQKYLHENGIETFYVSGTYKNGWEGESHTWLETNEGVVIDITGDQYKYKELKFEEPVYVGLRDDGFHERFHLNPLVPYNKNDDPNWNAQYMAIISCLL